MAMQDDCVMGRYANLAGTAGQLIATVTTKLADCAAFSSRLWVGGHGTRTPYIHGKAAYCRISKFETCGSSIQLARHPRQPGSQAARCLNTKHSAHRCMTPMFPSLWIPADQSALPAVPAQTQTRSSLSGLITTRTPASAHSLDPFSTDHTPRAHSPVPVPPWEDELSTSLAAELAPPSRPISS